MFLGEYFQTQYRGRFYGKAQNMMRAVTQLYPEVLNGVDMLLMPTMPMKSQPIPPSDCCIADYIQRAFEMVGNTAPHNATGLPAITLPCGLSEGLPIGVMLESKFYNEAVIYQVAHAFEQTGDWRNMQGGPIAPRRVRSRTAGTAGNGRDRRAGSPSGHRADPPNRPPSSTR